MNRQQFREFLGKQFDKVYLHVDTEDACITRVLEYCEKEGVEWLPKEEPKQCLCGHFDLPGSHTPNYCGSMEANQKTTEWEGSWRKGLKDAVKEMCRDKPKEDPKRPPHDWETNSCGGTQCKNCHAWQSTPQWPPFCEPKQEPKEISVGDIFDRHEKEEREFRRELFDFIERAIVEVPESLRTRFL